MNKFNINDRFTKMIDELMETRPPIEERKKIIDELNNMYFKEIERVLPYTMLERLGTWLLAETYSDTRANKASIEEYPILSEIQLYRRKRKNVLIQEEGTLDSIQYYKHNAVTKHHSYKKEGCY